MKLESETEVVISGVGGNFPKSINAEIFKQGLLKNESLLESRWQEGERGVTNIIGKMPDIEFFDVSFFGIYREQCSFMDPMQRLVMERTFEALLDAGVNPMEIRGKKVGVYTGASIGENDNIFYETIVSGFGVTGHSRSMMPNRVSYWLNLKGPSCAYDSNWLNGIEVIHAAYEAIKEGHCESAIVATANLVLNSELNWVYNDMGLISPNGTTRSFDANAHGYARSDGVIVLYIQRACDAKRSYATILSVDLHFNGSRDGTFRDLDTDAMTDFLRKFYTNCKVDPKDVEFVECYGAGISHIDEAELTAIDRVYCKDRDKPLLVGSVKPNTGHAEASSNLMSLVKVLIAMESGIIPATINYKLPNPKIPSLIEGRIEVVDKNREWNPNLVAVNGIGLASSYGHILLKANPKVKTHPTDNLPRLVAISTRTEPGIQKILTSLKSEIKLDQEYVGLIQDTFKKTIPGHLYRGYAVLDGTEEQKSEFEHCPGNKRQIWFVYSGMGSQWCKMGNDLMALPIFAEAIYKCQKVLEPKGVDLLRILTEDDEKMFDNILHSFVGIAAVQIGLTDVLRVLEIVPDGIIGHSVGELGCAYADRCLSAEQMILSAYSRGRASLEAKLIKGMMAAVGKGYEQMKDQCPPSIEIACHNGPDSCTISGPTEDMQLFVEKLQDKGCFARLVNVSNIAYHSKYIKPAAPLLLKYLQEVIPYPLPRTSKWISTSIPDKEWGTDLAQTSSAEYHTNNLLRPVLFEEGSKHIPKEAIVIEIAPHGLLQAILKRSLRENCTSIPLTHKATKNQLQFLLSAVGKLYLAGLDLKIAALYPKIEYPVSRGTKSLSPLVHWEHSEKLRAGQEEKINYVSRGREVIISLKNENYKNLLGNQFKNTIIVPISTYLAILYNLFTVTKITKITEVVFQDLQFKRSLQLPKLGNISLYIIIHRGSGDFELSSENELIATGTIKTVAYKHLFTTVKEINVTSDGLQLAESDVYSEFYHRGHKYGEVYKAIRNLKLTHEGSFSTINWDNNWSHCIEAMLQQCLFEKGERSQNILAVSSVQRIAISLPLLPTELTDLKITYNYATGMIYTKGIQISGVGVVPLKLENRPISYDSLELTPLFGRMYKNIESGINLSLHLVMDNFENQNVNSVMIVEIITENPVLENNIKNVVEKYTMLSANIASVKDSKLILISQTEPFLAIINNTLTEDCIKLLTSHAFLLARTDKNVLRYSEITQVAQFFVGGISYSLMRKSEKDFPLIIPIKTNSFSSKDLLHDNASWVCQLKSAVGEAQGRKNIYLVSSNVPLEGITNFVHDLRALPDMHNIKLVFILAKNAPEFTVNEKSYAQIFKNNLSLNIVKDGYIGCYIPMPIEIKDVPNVLQTTSNIVANTRMDFLGINVRDETVMLKNDHIPELGNIDYSGITSFGQKIMGLAHLNTEFCKLVPDSILFWSVPQRWSLQDAATVPHAYIMAYYAIVVVGKTKANESILVHGGCSAFGLAAISIASNIGCTVFTTVTSDRQKSFMKKQFHFLGDHNIFSARNTSFEPRVMVATAGKGVHVILNCLSGSLLNATLRCIAEYGKFVQVGKVDIEEDRKIGMRMFLKNLSFSSITLEDIFDASVEVKQQLHDLVEEGLRNLIVRPIYRIVVQHQNIRSVLSTLKRPECIGKVLIQLSDNLELGQLNVNNTSQFICEAKNSYLVYGGSSEMWVDVIEWLIVRGARKIVVASQSQNHPAHINRRLKLFERYFDANIMFALKEVHSQDNASELLSEVYRFGPIGGVFILPNKHSASIALEIRAVEFLDFALKSTAPKAVLVNFLSHAGGVCQLRTDAGFPTYHLQWANSLEFSDVLYALDDMMRFKIQQIFIKDDYLRDNIQETSQSLYKKLNLLLPISIEQIKEEIAVALEVPAFLQLPSLCARNVREVPPVFVIPGMFGRKAVKELASQLLYPVFCANFPSVTMPLQSTAVNLAAAMKNIHSRGPYNIIAVSYGGVLATEIANILESDQAKVQVIFVDAAPDTIQGILKHLGEGANSEIGFLCRLLNLTSPSIVKTLSALSGWNRRLTYALQQSECSSKDIIYLRDTLPILKKYFDEISAYLPLGKLIEGSVSLLRPSGAHKYDVCGIPKYFKETAEICLVDADHLTIVKNRLTAGFINNKIKC